MPTLEDFLSHPIETLEKALHIRKQIEELQKQLTALFGAHPPALSAVQLLEPKRRGRRKGSKMSPAARARIAAAQRARWAKQKSAHGPETDAVPEREKAKKKRGMSPEGRARIAEAQKARWAKANGRKAPPADAETERKNKKGI